MSNVTWIIENGVFSCQDRLVLALHQSNTPHQVIDRPINFIPNNTAENYLFYGSLAGSRVINARLFGSIGDNIVDVFNNKELTNFLSYAPVLSLLNSKYTLCQRHQIQEHWPNDTNYMFVRSASGQKLLNGRVYALHELQRELDLQNFLAKEILVLSREQKIDSEVRCVVIDGCVVSYSCYSGKTPTNIEKLIDFANSQNAKIQAVFFSNDYDEPYTIDIAVQQGKYSVVEVNSFSCADFYQAHCLPILAKINERYSRPD